MTEYVTWFRPSKKRQSCLNLMNPHPTRAALLSVLHQIVADQTDPYVYYQVKASYFIQDGERRDCARVTFNRRFIKEVRLAHEGIFGLAMLDRKNRHVLTPILIPYDHIWQVARNDVDVFRNEHIIYFDEPVMKAMFDYLINLPEDNQDHA